MHTRLTDRDRIAMGVSTIAERRASFRWGLRARLAILEAHNYPAAPRDRSRCFRTLQDRGRYVAPIGWDLWLSDLAAYIARRGRRRRGAR